MSAPDAQELPNEGDTLEVNVLCGTVSGKVVLCLKNGMVLLETSDGNYVLAVRSKYGDQWWHEPNSDSAWEDPAYVKLRRAEVQPQIGDHVHVALMTELDSEDDECGCLQLTGTVEATFDDGATRIAIDPFQLDCGPDYWIDTSMPSHLDCEAGVFLPSGKRLN